MSTCELLMKMKGPLVLFGVALTIGCASTTTRPADAGSGPPPRALEPGDAQRGEVLGRKLCVTCHGVRGDGRGPGSVGLDPPPRDFVRAVYRYRSTPTGSLPTDADLARSILRGLPGTSMPAFRDLVNRRDVVDLVAWVKTFSPRWKEELVDDPIDIPAPPPATPASVVRGRELYTDLQCGKCHGEDGSGNGWGTKEDFRDALGRIAEPRDLRQGIYRSGTRPQNLYRSLVTGLDGSPMPAYEDTLSPDEVYSLVDYVVSLDRGSSIWRWLSRSPRWYEPGDVQLKRDGR
ncbi:MAG: c-type cytochrome [Myxococcota bacterium]